MKGIPRDLDEAARVDGCSIYGIFLKIILPLVKPALVTSAIFSFMWRWDDFLSPLIYISDPMQYPVSYALKMFSDPTVGSDWGAMFAMATLSLIPIFLIFLTMQKYCNKKLIKLKFLSCAIANIIIQWKRLERARRMECVRRRKNGRGKV